MFGGLNYYAFYCSITNLKNKHNESKNNTKKCIS